MLRYIIALAVAVMALPMQGRTAGDFFGIEAADTAFPILGAATRLDMLDYARSGLATPSNNLQDGVARITSVTDGSIHLTPAAGVSASLDVLASGRDTVLMVIETLPLPQKDSRITFYDTRWQKLAKQPFEMPTLRDWLPAGDKAALAQAYDEIPFMLAEAAYDPDTRILTLSNTLGGYFAEGDAPATLGRMHATLQYALDEKLRFRRTTKQ